MDSELPIFVGLAVLLALVAMMVTLESTVLPFIFLTSIGLAVIYNMGTNIFLGVDLVYHQGYRRCFAVGRHHGLLHLPLPPV